MAKKKPSREYLYSWGKWQALKRNPEYRKDYREIQQRLRTRDEVSLKWDIYLAFPPNWTYEHLLQLATHYIELAWSLFGQEYKPSSEEDAIGVVCLWLQPFNRRAVTWQDRSEYDKLRVKLPLNFSSKTILEKIENLLQLNRNKIKIIDKMDAASCHEVDPEKKPISWHQHLDNVENYFLVDKLKKEERKSWREIERILEEGVVKN
jgi:hypothetical protein